MYLMKGNETYLPQAKKFKDIFVLPSFHSFYRIKPFNALQGIKRYKVKNYRLIDFH